MLSQRTHERTYKGNLLLASTTAITAGMTNFAGLLACYAFTSNITGHAATLAKQMLNGDLMGMLTIFIWLLLFMSGAMAASFLIRSFQHKSSYFAHALPIIIETLILAGVAFYGSGYNNDTVTETSIIAGSLLFCMGLQNGAVSTIGGGLKTSHLTGLFTDLGTEIAEWLHPTTGDTKKVKLRLFLRFTILFSYITGALIGGWLFIKIDFATFYVIGAILLFIISYDLSKMVFKKHFKSNH